MVLLLQRVDNLQPLEWMLVASGGGLDNFWVRHYNNDPPRAHQEEGETYDRGCSYVTEMNAINWRDYLYKPWDFHFLPLSSFSSTRHPVLQNNHFPFGKGQQSREPTKTNV